MGKAKIINEYGGKGDSRGEYVRLVPRTLEKVRVESKSGGTNNKSIKKKKLTKLDKVSKSYNYSKKLSNSLLEYGSVFGGGSTQQVQKTAGRPRQVFVHTSPFTGKPVPAPQYYKELRAYKRMQQIKAENLREQQIRQYAQQGVPPNQIQQVQERIRQQQMVQQLQQQQPQIQQQNIPRNVQGYPLQNGTVIPRGTPVWKYRRGVVGTDAGLFGKRQLVFGLPESFWN